MSLGNITDVSGKLGEYMLKGWVLTDRGCPNASCSVPLMRSPNGVNPVTHFCANCDGGPKGSNSVLAPVPKQLPLTVSTSSPSISSSSHVSRMSTPPTEVSSTLSSPTFALPVDTEESRRRRQQSDTASSEIGKRLLKGWAMLADECPNSTCFGVPLVRPPMAGGVKAANKECVICGNVYATEANTNGWERLVPVNIRTATAEQRTPSVTTFAIPAVSRDKGKTAAREERILVPSNYSPDTPSASGISRATQKATHVPSKLPVVTDHSWSTATLSVLESSGRALETTLQLLTDRITALSSGHNIVDPTSIALTAEAIGKVVHALSQVKQLYHSESGIPVPDL